MIKLAEVNSKSKEPLKAILIFVLTILGSIGASSKVTGPAYFSFYENSDPWEMVNGIYVGLCQNCSLTFEIHTRTPWTKERLDNPYGYIEFGEGKRIKFICYETSCTSKYEVRVKRPSNPALFGEYLSWKAYVEVDSYFELHLSVVEDLSSIEKTKYKLPSKGAKCTLELSKVCN